MKAKGVRFAPIYGRQAFKVDGKAEVGGAVESLNVTIHQLTGD